MRTLTRQEQPYTPPQPRVGGAITRVSTGAERYSQLIRRKRRQRKISQAQVAEEVGVRAQTFIGWEKGSTERFNLDEMRRVGDLLGFNQEDYLAIFGFSPGDTTEADRRGGFEADPELTEDDRRLLRALQSKLRRGDRREEPT